MNQYPIVTIDKEQWNKKVNACLMYTIPSEDEALPILCQLQQILSRLHNLPLQQTLSEDLVQFFFIQVFPVVCQKIIKSRYFKNQAVLKKANQILQSTVCLLPVYFDRLQKIPQFIEVLMAVFSEQFYFKTNNQLDHKDYPYLYFSKQQSHFQQFLQKASKVDVMKFSSNNEKFFWTHGQITEITETHIFVAYELDYEYSCKKIQKNSHLIAPYQSQSTTFQWRKNLKTGDLIDALDSFGGWYNATVIGVETQEDGRKKVEVTLKVYNQNGTKSDQSGKFYGFSDYKQKYDAFGAQIAPYCSVAKEFCYESSKSQFQMIDDQNDLQFKQTNNKKIYAFPRRRNLSQTIFNALNRFGQLGGFHKCLQIIQKKADMGFLSFYLKGLSGVTSYLHKQVVLEHISRLKVLLQKNILSENSTYSKQKSQMLFNGMRALFKRVYTSEVSYEYENNLKIQLVQRNFHHDSLKKKLHGLNQLKEIIKSLTFGSSRNKKIIEWIKQHKIFEKVYLVSSHVQLIKKSESFFRYIINENILQVQDLQKLLKMAQKGDYQTRISLYSLFQQVSHIFKKPHVNFLIDKILQSEPNLILNEDIDLLHQLSKFSNYFPTKKVMQFFQKLTLGEQIPQEINNYAIKKYSDMIAKNYQLKPYRKEVMKQLFLKMKTHDITKVAKILKHIFEGIGFGQWGKKDLNQMLEEQKFDEVVISCIKVAKEKKNKSQIISQCMELLLCIYKVCSSFKIQLNTIEQIYQEVCQDKRLLQNYYKWSNQAFKCQQGIQVENISQLADLFVKLFQNRKASSAEDVMNSSTTEQSVILQELELLKSIFIEVNKRKKLLSVSNIMKEKSVEKEYKRKVPMKELTFYHTLIEFIYDTYNLSAAQKSIQFFKVLYCSGQNTQQEIEAFLMQNLHLLKQNAGQNAISEITKKKIMQTLRIIEFVIDDSEKDCAAKVESLISKKKTHQIKLNFINSVSFISDTVKKMEVTIPVNYTLYDLRVHLAKQLDLAVKAVKIQLKKQIPYQYNCRTMKELGLTGLQTLTVSKKPVPSQPEGEIIIDSELNPKASRVFEKIFELYSTDGKMNKDQCHEFTVKCLGSASSPKFYEEKISNLFKQYDENQDDFLEVKQFLKFYKTAALSRSSTVWSNLRSFGVQGNFKFGYEVNEQLDLEKIPRNIMSKMTDIYDLLFRLLKEKQLASAAFQLLERLPVSKRMEQQIISLDSQEFNFDQILNTTDLYVFFYKLNIIEYLSISLDLKSQEQRDWVSRFAASKGFEQIIHKLFDFIAFYQSKSEGKSKVLLQILDILVGISTWYMMKCFITKPILSCQVFLMYDIQLSDKIQYLVTGHFSKPEIAIKQIPNEISQELVCQDFEKEQILHNMLNLFELLWRALQSNQKSVQYSEQNIETILNLQRTLISKVMVVIPLLQINQNFGDLVSRISGIIRYSKNKQFLKKFYQLLACLAFYSEDGKGQKPIINQMFKHLTMKNIISEHFSILAVLVSKYGVQTVNEQQIISVLVNNIFNSDNELTIEGCSRLMLNFDLKSLNQKQFDNLWENCLFGEQKRAKKNSTRQALYQLVLKATDKKPKMTNYIISQIKKQISQCIQHMRITSCTEDNQRSSHGYVGLKNLGNICYINSMMQQLYMNKSFRYLVLRMKDNEPEKLGDYKGKMYDDNILHQLQKIFAFLQLTSRADYVPQGFCLAYKPFGESVNVMMQQDVQQFVSMFFDQLENKIKQTPFKKVLDIFYGGKTTNLFTCHDCNQSRKVEQNFYSITLQVKNSKTLSESFNRYILGQLISDFRCDFCNKKVDVSKKTRISKPPRILLLHLQRIFFNLDTFINEKITTRHEFGHTLDLYPYTLAEYEKAKQITPEDEKAIRDSMEYHLSGIICHIGNAESGHYISYIKIEQNKWIQLNDSQVTSFNPTNIQAQCFGGATNSFIDDFQWDKSTQTSKSAYVLLYERQGETKIQAIVKSIQQKQVFLKEFSLAQVLQKLSTQQKPEQSNKSEDSEQIDSFEQETDDKLQEQILKLEVEQKIRKKSRDIQLQIEQNQQLQKQITQSKEVTVHIDQNIQCFIPQSLKKQIMHDNQIHFFQKNLASPAFVKFFAHLLKQQHECHEDIIKMLKTLTFGFWTKSQHFKDLLKTCFHFIQINPKYSDDFIFSNPQIITYLIENPDSQVRTSVAEFLVSTFSSLIQTNNLALNGQTQLDTKIVAFLDQLFSLLPTLVSRSWTKFGQYFQFWYDFSMKGNIQLSYMIKKQVLKHFLDYYLDKKSPLKIYENKPQIGSKYANPNFSMLLKTVTYLISSVLNSQKFKLSKDDYTILIHFECMQKLISENCQNLAMNLVKQICKNNLYASEKVAIILLKGLHKSTYNNVQAYLDVLHAFVLIQDGHQQLRVKWVLGKPILNISTSGKQIQAITSYAFEQRVYTYHSSLSLEQGSSLLDPIYELHKRAQNFAMMSLKQALRLSTVSDYIFEYIWNLPPPTLCYGKIYDFYSQFIQKYLEDAKRSYSYNSTGFNKEELANEVKKMYDQLSLRWSQKNPMQSAVSGYQKSVSQDQVKECSQIPTSEQSVPSSTIITQQQQKIKTTNKIYYPVKFNFIEKQETEIDGLQIVRHQSELTFVLLQPTLKSNDSFLVGGMQRNSDRIKEDVWQSAKVQIVTGFLAYNKSKHLLRIKTEDGTQLVKSNDHTWVWANKIQRVWECERTGDWPKWSLYSIDQSQQEQLQNKMEQNDKKI